MSSAPCDVNDSLPQSGGVPDPQNTDLSGVSRRQFLQSASALGVGLTTNSAFASAKEMRADLAPHVANLTLKINGQDVAVKLDTRTSLLDALREHLGMTGSKKGCDHGQCGACTVLVDGRRVNSCLLLAVSAAGRSITTIEGLSRGEELHPVQQSFLDHDGFQCGYCTPGQICSAVALLDEVKRGEVSVVSYENNSIQHPSLTDDEIRERMSGNICRCGAYPNIVAAVRAAAKAVSL